MWEGKELLSEKKQPANPVKQKTPLSVCHIRRWKNLSVVSAEKKWRKKPRERMIGVSNVRALLFAEWNPSTQSVDFNCAKSQFLSEGFLVGYLHGISGSTQRIVGQSRCEGGGFYHIQWQRVSQNTPRVEIWNTRRVESQIWKSETLPKVTTALFAAFAAGDPWYILMKMIMM